MDKHTHITTSAELINLYRHELKTPLTSFYLQTEVLKQSFLNGGSIDIDRCLFICEQMNSQLWRMEDTMEKALTLMEKNLK